jgi:hypothetical protein
MSAQPTPDAESIDNPFWDIVRPFVRTDSKFALWGGPQIQQFVGFDNEPPGVDHMSPAYRDWYRVEMDKLPQRKDLVSEYAWAVPSPATLRRLVALDLGPVVELGAGSGYWAFCLEQLGMDFVCYDENPPGDTTAEGNHWHPGTRQWVPVLKAGIEAIAMHPDRALMLCWPPYNEAMAAKALRAYQGNTLIYIGEGHGGCTADDEFFAMLGDDTYDEDYNTITNESEWKHVESIGVIQWEGLHDTCEVYRRA